MDRYFPGTAWLRMQRESVDRLASFKARNALATWEEAVDALLDGALMDAVRPIADAVLYEGYVLWPYRRSATEEPAPRWTFGGVYPRRTARHPTTRDAQCLLEGAGARSTCGAVPARRRQASPRVGSSTSCVGRAHRLGRGDRARGRRRPARSRLPAAGWRMRAAGRRRRGADAGSVDAGRVARTARVRDASNRTPCAGDARGGAAATLCSAHIVLRTPRGAFVSLTDPPDRLREAAAACRNDGLWPVLVGDPGARDTVLASPIILEDHPRIAPESPGDLFDGGEIDQLLDARTSSALTDEEKAEMRAADPRAREILERTEALTREQLMRLCTAPIAARRAEREARGSR